VHKLDREVLRYRDRPAEGAVASAIPSSEVACARQFGYAQARQRVAVPTNHDSRAQVELVKHGRALYRLTRAREYHVSSTDVNPAIAERVSPTERSSA
jgi:hypothetical protein